MDVDAVKKLERSTTACIRFTKVCNGFDRFEVDRRLAKDSHAFLVVVCLVDARYIDPNKRGLSVSQR